MDVIGNLRFISLGNGELQNAIIERLSADPTGEAGRIYYNDVANEYRFFNGTSWLPIGSGADISSLQTEVDELQASLGSFILPDGTFDPTPLNLLDNVDALSAGSPTDSLMDALTQLDAAITAAATTGGADKLTELTDVQFNNSDVELNSILVAKTIGSPVQFVDRNPGEARNDLAVVGRAGDTMTGDLVIDGANLVVENNGSAAAPSIAFGSPADTGLFTGNTTSLGDTVDFVGVTVNGTQVARFEQGGSPEFTRLFVVDEVTVTDGAVITDQNSTAAAPGYSFLGDEDTGMFHDTANEVAFSVGGNEALRIESDGVLSVAGTTDYETLLSDDDDIPNKAYVDAEILAATPTLDLDDLGNVADTSAGADWFVVSDGAGSWITENATDARTSLGLVAGGAGDIWVEKAGDTMTGALVVPAGTAGAPSLTFTGDTDTGIFSGGTDRVDVATQGTSRFYVESTRVTSNVDIRVQAGETFFYQGSTPSTIVFRPSEFTDVGFGTGSSGSGLGLIQAGVLRLDVRTDGSLSVAGTTNYETLVTDDDDIPNKKYVDDTIASEIAATTYELDDLTDVTLTAPVDDSFLVYDNGSGQWIDESPATARTTLGLVSGGAGDIWVDAAGDTMSGNLNMGSNSITNVADPTAGADAATKAYVDNVASGLSARPAVDVLADSDGIDSVGGAWTYAAGGGSPVGVGATLTRNANGAAGTIDGVASTLDERVLVAGRTNAEENGIYTITQVGDASNPTILTRCGTCDENSEIPSAFVFVQQGTTYGDTGWVASVADPSTFQIGTDDINWLQFSGSGSIIPGTGLSLTGTTLNVNLGAGIYEGPTDEVGIDLYDIDNNALILTVDGTTRQGPGSPATGTQLALLLNGSALTQGPAGLGVAATTLSGDVGAGTTFIPSDTVNFVGGTGIQVAVGSPEQTVTITNTSPNVDQNLFETISADSGGPLVASSATDTLTIAGGTNVDTSLSGSTLTIDSPLQDVFATVTGDSGTATANAATDNLAVVGGTGITTAVAGSPATITITNDSPNVAQDVFATVTGDSGTATANSVTDNLAIVGGTNVTTTVSGSPATVTIDSPLQDLFATFTANSGSTTADAAADTLTVTGGTGINTSISGDTLTITNTAPNVVQNLFETFTGDTGSVTAAGATDSLRVRGDIGITTTAAAAGGSPEAVEVAIELTADLDDLQDVAVTSPAAGETLVVDSGGDFVNRPIYAESGLRAASTSHVYAHNLNQQWVTVTVLDSSDQVIIPNSVTMTNANEVTVTFGTSIQCRIIVMGVSAA